MRLAIRFGLGSAVLFGLFASACGGGGTGSGGSGGTSTSTSDTSTATSTATSTGTTSTGTTTSSSASGTGGGPALFNGCDPMTAEDHLKDATVEIKFGDPIGFVYSPACIKVKSGTMVTFTGNTLSHPLDAGQVMGTTPVPDANSPIKPTSDGSKPSVTFTIAPAGTYGFFCDDHFAGGMQGAIFAQ
jgi:plastocyanin